MSEVELNRHDKWLRTMMAKLDTDETGVKEYMRDVANRSRRNQGGSGGFAYLKQHSPEQHKLISRKGGKTKHADHS
jgi:hypothetical protein